jgi:hypothetical protein
MRNIRSQRAHARATAPPLPSPAHHMATMAKASVTSARALNPSLVDALFECNLEWKDASYAVSVPDEYTILLAYLFLVEDSQR